MRKTLLIPAGLIAGAGALVSAVAGTAAATPGSGVVGASVVARGAFVEPVDLKLKVDGAHGREVIDVRDAADTVVQQVQLAPGGHTGWHRHHGPVVVVVTSGTLTAYNGDHEGCAGTTYTAGQTFIDPGHHVHIARNTGGGAVEFWATFFNVPPGGSPRIDAAAPRDCAH